MVRHHNLARYQITADAGTWRKHRLFPLSWYRRSETAGPSPDFYAGRGVRTANGWSRRPEVSLGAASGARVLIAYAVDCVGGLYRRCEQVCFLSGTG